MRGFGWIKKLRQHKKDNRKTVIYRGYTFQSEIDQKEGKAAYNFIVWKTREAKSMKAIRLTIEEYED